MTQNSTGYPFIGEVAGERGGILQLPAVDSALFTAPTASMGIAMTAASIGIGYVPGGHFKIKFNGTVYRVPCFTNVG